MKYLRDTKACNGKPRDEVTFEFGEVVASNPTEYRKQSLEKEPKLRWRGLIPESAKRVVGEEGFLHGIGDLVDELLLWRLSHLVYVGYSARVRVVIPRWIMRASYVNFFHFGLVVYTSAHCSLWQALAQQQRKKKRKFSSLFHISVQNKIWYTP